MAITPLPLPQPGDTNWAGPLNASLEQLNQDVGEISEAGQDILDAAGVAQQSALDAETARDESVSAAERAEAVPAQVDTAMAEQVGTGGEFDTKLNATIGAEVAVTRSILNPLTTAARGAHPHSVSLITGSPDETGLGAMSRATLTVDTVNYRLGQRARKMTSTVSGPNMRWNITNPEIDGTSPAQMPPWQALCLWVYIPAAADIQGIELSVFYSADLNPDNRWRSGSYSPDVAPLVDGWNFLRMPAYEGHVMQEGRPIHRIDLSVMPNPTALAGYTVTIGHMYFETPPKARFLHIADRGYKTFLEGIYPDMKARGWPITVAVDVTRFGSQAGTIHEAMTEAQVHELANDGNGNSISFHGWDGSPTGVMTVEELTVDTIRSIKWLQKHGYSGRMWRAAYVKGGAPHWEAMRPYLVGAASGSASRVGPTLWPPNDINFIVRQSLDNNQTFATIDRWFQYAKWHRLTYLPFVHGMDPEYVADVSAALWDHYRDHLDAAVEEGWAEVVTFEQLFLEMGGSFSTVNGGMVAEYTDARTGERIVKTVL